MRAIIAKNNLSFIGLNDGLPWKCSEDLKHFKKLTGDSLLVVGPKTLSTLPKLPGRTTLEAKSDFTKWIDVVGSFPFVEGEEVWCIGGKKTYEMLCPWFTELHISHINENTIGDTMFPDFSNLNKECKIFNYYFDV